MIIAVSMTMWWGPEQVWVHLYAATAAPPARRAEQSDMGARPMPMLRPTPPNRSADVAVLA
jgi:hypothetical protein